MTPERWRRLQELFAGAVERRSAERDAYLRAACGDDESRVDLRTAAYVVAIRRVADVAAARAIWP